MGSITISKGEICSVVTDLVKKIKASGRYFTTVVGIEQGGQVSKIIADCLQLEHKTVKIGFYEGLSNKPYIEKNGFDLMKCIGCLVVNDLIDSGRTITTFKETFGWREQRDAVAVLYWKRGAVLPDFYGKEKPEGWLVFPWEQERKIA